MASAAQGPQEAVMQPGESFMAIPAGSALPTAAVPLPGEGSAGQSSDAACFGTLLGCCSADVTARSREVHAALLKDIACQHLGSVAKSMLPSE